MIRLSAPGKTFLLGEYVALDGGPSIIATTAPRFELSIVEKKTESSPRVSAHDSHMIDKWPFHDASPAGRFLSRHPARFEHREITFHDPHHGLGGLGASSAQFGLLYSSLQLRAPETPQDWSSLLEEYRACAWNGEGTPPSGADVVAQLAGGLICFNGRNFDVERLKWTFTGLGFTLLRTGAKLATHEHLRKGALAPIDVLRTIVNEGLKAFQTADEARLVEAVHAAAHVLRAADLVAPGTLELLDQMRLESAMIYAAKGCGAMGADVILVLHDHARVQDVAAWAEARGLTVCGGLDAVGVGLDSGLKVEMDV